MKKYMSIVDDLLSLESVRYMANYNQHRRINTLLHCMNVSYTVYKICLKLKLEPYEIVRAAFLHDFYLYDWHRESNIIKHAFNHPKVAVRNIEKYNLPLSKKSKEMILSHMFPLSPIPRSMGAWILTIADKYCTCIELFGYSENLYSRFTKILS